MIKQTIQKNIQQNRGYTLLFAVLVSSVVLSVGISILTISKKEFLLSSSARDSMVAYYAADSALECTINQNDNYIDDIFSTSSATLHNESEYNSVNNCFGGPIKIRPTVVQADKKYTFEFDAKMQNDLSNSCAVVFITKEFDNEYSTTTIISRGYNTGWDKATERCEKSSPKRVERAMEYSF